MADKTGKKIVISAGDQDLNFSVSLPQYNAYVNEMTMDNKVAPGRNFLNRTVEPEDKAQLEELMDQGLTMDLVGLVVSAFKPQVKLTVKK